MRTPIKSAKIIAALFLASFVFSSLPTYAQPNPVADKKVGEEKNENPTDDPALEKEKQDEGKEDYHRNTLLVPTGKIKRLEEQDQSILQRHNPFYFAYGNPLSKLQLSFKTPLFRKVPVYFGYTQIMFWALTDDSKPFRDSTYNPELFYRYQNDKWGQFESIDFGAWNHMSNGKAEKDSRSLEKQYIRANIAREGKRWVTRFSAELAYLHNFDPTNKDIRDYMGPLSLYVSFLQLYDTSWVDKSEITLKAQPGGKYANRWEKGGYQLSWSFRLGKLDIIPSFYLQYYHGYAETLLNYNKDIDTFRAGFIF